MNVDVHIENEDLEGALRTYIKRRLHFALGRFAGKLGRVRVWVEDVLGTGNELDASCHIQAELLPAGRILRQEAVDRNLYVAVDLATERIGRAFARELELAHLPRIVREISVARKLPRKRM